MPFSLNIVPFKEIIRICVETLICLPLFFFKIYLILGGGESMSWWRSREQKAEGKSESQADSALGVHAQFGLDPHNCKIPTTWTDTKSRMHNWATQAPLAALILT